MGSFFRSQQNNPLMKSVEACDGTSGTGGNGIIIVFDSVQLPYKLNTVLHSQKFPGYLTDSL